MSLVALTAVWTTVIPRIEVQDGPNVSAQTAKLLLLALADHAHDDGGAIWPAQSRLVERTGMARRNVQRGLAALVGAGYLELVEPATKTRAAHYNLSRSRFPQLELATRRGVTRPPERRHTTASRGVTRPPELSLNCPERKPLSIDQEDIPKADLTMITKHIREAKLRVRKARAEASLGRALEPTPEVLT